MLWTISLRASSRGSSGKDVGRSRSRERERGRCKVPSLNGKLLVDLRSKKKKKRDITGLIIASNGRKDNSDRRKLQSTDRWTKKEKQSDKW